jgi:predicted TIM-barrel fold metal-dependent hydrolase
MWMPWLESAIQFFGIDRMMFGTDFPWGDTKGIIDNIERAVDNHSDLEKIYEGNAKRVIGFR